MKYAIYVVWCWFAFAVTSHVHADIPEPTDKLAMPAIVLRAAPAEWIRIHRESQKNPASLLQYLDEHVRFMESRKGSPLVYEFSPPGDILKAETFGFVFTRLGDVGTPDLLPALQEYIKRRQAQNDWASRKDIAYARLAIERIEARAKGPEAYRNIMLDWVEHWERYPDAVSTNGKPTSRACLRFADGVRALAQIGDTTILERVLKAWERAEREMPRAAWIFNRPLIVHDLAKFEDARILPLLRDNLPLYGYAHIWDYHLQPGEKDPVWAYWQIRTKDRNLRQTVQVMLQAAGGEGPSRGVTVVLSHLGRDAVPVLLEYLRNPPSCPQPDRAVAALVGALGRMRAREAVPPLLDLLSQTNSPLLRRVITSVLGEIGDPAALPSLLQSARSSEDILLQIASIEALGAIADPRAEPLLLELLTTHPDAKIRYNAAEALRTVGTASSIPVLEQRLQIETDNGTRGQIRTTLQTLRQKAR